jgi:peroxiredoxin
MKVILTYFLGLLFPYILFAQSKEELTAQIKANLDKTETAQLIAQLGGNDPDYKEMEALYKKLDRKVKKSTQGKILKRHIDAVKKSSPGRKAPGITQFDLAGEPYSLQNLKGKYVLVSFWASWNTASRQQIPLLKELYSQFKDNNFEILGVSYDSDFNAWNKYVEDNNLNWKHISDLQSMNNGSALGYGIKAIPQNVIVDPTGIIVARNLWGENLKEKLSELLKQ